MDGLRAHITAPESKYGYFQQDFSDQKVLLTATTDSDRYVISSIDAFLGLFLFWIISPAIWSRSYCFNPSGLDGSPRIPIEIPLS